MTARGIRRVRRRIATVSPLTIGVALIVMILVAGLALFNKNRILTELKSGQTIKIHFASGSRLVPYLSQTKVAFVRVGVVTGVKQENDGTALVSVKVDNGTRAKLGSQPSAVIRPTTLLGGNYFVDLIPGGSRVPFRGEIALSRTAPAVELDKVATALQPRALKGIQVATAKLDAAVQNGGRSSLDQLAADAPAALVPAATVLTAVQGENRFTDLTKLVANLERTGRVLTAKQGQLDDIITRLSQTTGVLSNRAQDIASTIADLPGALESAHAGLQRLDATLLALQDTASSARPVAKTLNSALRHANPVLIQAVPVVRQLDRLLIDAEPVVQHLVPATRGYTSVLEGVGGPVLDRINGPVKKVVLGAYHGAGPYAGTGSDKPLYQELGYMFATLDRASSMVDRNGHTVALQPGVGPGSIGGLPISLEQMFTVLTNKFNLTPRNGGK